MQKRKGENFARFVKTGTGAVIAAAVIAVLCGSRVPLKNSSDSDIVSSVLPVSTSVPGSFSKSVESTSGTESATINEPSVEAPELPEQPSAVMVNINPASIEELKELSGIGEAKAAAILAYREEHGVFTDIGEIKNVSGIGDKLFEDIRGSITAGKVGETPPQSTVSETTEPPETALININTAPIEELKKLSGIGDVKAAAIIAYREEHGAFGDISEITNVSGIGEKTFEKISGQITV